ncbi:phage portal protein [Terriglobus aquaticus]|uniref:Phage portal protein n=1 Tax=Terriglobus aquaticus TaxID=940139 RepID=A0ABW9KIQ8_9BACT|nr:phage portal protein [Terriglobus aquaticus]
MNPGAFEVFRIGSGTEAGAVISNSSAMQISTVFACVKVLAETVSSLPLRLYRVTAGGRTPETSHPLSRLLTLAPNEEQSSLTLIETFVTHLCLTGNAYVFIERDSSGKPVGLWNLQPQLTEPSRKPDNTLYYRTSDGEAAGQSRVIAAEDMLHFRLMTWNGILGLSPILQCKRSLGLSIAAEQYASRFFSNGAVPMMALSTEQKVDPLTKQKMRTDWETLQTRSNQHRIAILDNGLKAERFGITNEEAQFLESRAFTRADVAGIFRVPAHMIGELGKMTNSNTEQMNLQFITQTISPLLARIEAEIALKLLMPKPGQAAVFQIGFDTAELIRGDFLTQMQGCAIGRQGGWLTGNDCRRIQGLHEAGPELDVYSNPVNMENSLELLKQGKPPQQGQVPDA